MTSFLIRVFELAYFVEHDTGYQLSTFQCSRISGSNFMEGVDPPQCYNEIKSPELLGLKDIITVVLKGFHFYISFSLS